jgi:hypothetical protein
VQSIQSQSRQLDARMGVDKQALYVISSCLRCRAQARRELPYRIKIVGSGSDAEQHGQGGREGVGDETRW